LSTRLDASSEQNLSRFRDSNRAVICRINCGDEGGTVLQ
jgi:hypothetical protein